MTSVDPRQSPEVLYLMAAHRLHRDATELARLLRRGAALRRARALRTALDAGHLQKELAEACGVKSPSMTEWRQLLRQMERDCRLCGVRFATVKNNQRYCSEACAASAKRFRRAGYKPHRFWPGLLLAQRGRCGICGDAVTFEDLDSVHVDHIVPLSAGGSSRLDNLQTTHKRCNLVKGARVPRGATRGAA